MLRLCTLKACASDLPVRAVAGQSASGLPLFPPDADARVFLFSLPGAVGRKRGAIARIGRMAPGLHGVVSSFDARTFEAERLRRHAVETGRATA
ncbi:hypothetical protein JP74_09035 [Devosia sp. 17-2-E-8]|nr:hypothetical protein JP74_09035 [Devosia sp. 17-2-E-8]